MAIATVVPEPPTPCNTVAVCPELLTMKYHFCTSLGSIIRLKALLGDPPNTITLWCPFETDPSLVVRVVLPDTVKVITPFKESSIISKFVLVVVPQVPACSPEAIFSIPVFAVYVLAIFNPT